jgi:hypothetical protein
MAARGHVALFGVKYHAEMAWIEAKWCFLKNTIRKHLDGTIATLRKQLKAAFPQFKVEDARKRARKCRDTIAAYAKITDDDGLSQLRSLIDEAKTHRKPVMLHNNQLLVQTGEEIGQAALRNMEKAKRKRDTVAEFAAAVVSQKSEFSAKKDRQRRAARSKEQREADNLKSKERKKDNDELSELYAAGYRPTPKAPAEGSALAYRTSMMDTWLNI